MNVQQKPFSKAYIQQLERMCYAQIQKVVGEVRAGRGIIWVECLNNHVRPIEQQNHSDQAHEINAMYEFLIKDMKSFYRGETTLKLLQARWTQKQSAIGFDDIRVFRDSYQ